jgi:hypothetical protein
LVGVEAPVHAHADTLTRTSLDKEIIKPKVRRKLLTVWSQE